MPFKSMYPSLNIQQSNLLDYAFPSDTPPSEKPLWIAAENPKHYITQKDALLWAKRLGFGLEKAGVKKGEVVMIFTPNHIYVPPTYLGIVGAGYSFSAANPIYTVPEIVHQMTNVEAKILLVHPALMLQAVAAATKAGIPKSRIYQMDDKECPVKEGVQDWRALIGSESEGASWKWPKFSPEKSKTTIATINYSSGTTGPPKGVMISHACLIANATQSVFLRSHNKPLPLKDERWVGFLPLYHAYGQLYNCLVSCRLNTPVYVMKSFVFTDFCAAIQDYRITTIHLAPPVLVMLAKRPETKNYDLSSVEDVLCGAAPLSRDLQNECRKRFGWNILQGWGMTEVTCGGISMAGGDTDETGSVGKLIPNSECKLLDEAGNEVKPGEPGELYLKGPQVCLGYWRNEAATKETLLPGGWLKTGDIAVCNKEGRFWIVDRKKELIKVNALQVAPAELEAVLLENEHVADAAVVGITIHDEEWPRAYVALQEASKNKVTPEQIQEWIKPRVAKHKWLVGGVTFINEVPKLASGKIQRKVMREWAKKDAEIMKSTFKARF